MHDSCGAGKGIYVLGWGFHSQVWVVLEYDFFCAKNVDRKRIRGPEDVSCAVADCCWWYGRSRYWHFEHSLGIFELAEHKYDRRLHSSVDKSFNTTSGDKSTYTNTSEPSASHPNPPIPKPLHTQRSRPPPRLQNRRNAALRPSMLQLFRREGT